MDNIDYFYQKATVTDPNGNRNNILHNKLMAIRDFAVANTTAGDIEQHSAVNVTDDAFDAVTFHNIDNPNYTYDAIMKNEVDFLGGNVIGRQGGRLWASK